MKPDGFSKEAIANYAKLSGMKPENVTQEDLLKFGSMSILKILFRFYVLPITIFILLVGAVVMLVSKAGEKSPEQKARDKEWSLTVDGERRIKAVLKDPDSAKFSNQFISKEGVPCGEVNSKNGFGGYVGNKRYIGGNEFLTVIEGNGVSPADFEALWKTWCRQH